MKILIYSFNLYKTSIKSGKQINKGLVKNDQFLTLFNLSFNLFVIRQKLEMEQINEKLHAQSKKDGANIICQ